MPMILWKTATVKRTRGNSCARAYLKVRRYFPLTVLYFNVQDFPCRPPYIVLHFSFATVALQRLLVC